METAQGVWEGLGARAVVIFALDDQGNQHVATHGRSRSDAREAAKAGNRLKEALQWPASLLTAEPVPRLCKNYDFFTEDWGVFTATGWTGDGSSGRCDHLPAGKMTRADRFCSFFVPKA